MSTPVATVGLFYDTNDLQLADLSIFCRIVKGLNETPSVRGEDTVIPALGGRMEGLRVNDVLQIELEATVQSDTGLSSQDDQRASFRTNMKYIRGLFAPDRGRANLLAVLEDGTQLVVSALPLNMMWSENIPSMIAKGSIVLEAYDDWAEVTGS